MRTSSKHPPSPERRNPVLQNIEGLWPAQALCGDGIADGGVENAHELSSRAEDAKVGRRVPLDGLLVRARELWEAPRPKAIILQPGGRGEERRVDGVGVAPDGAFENGRRGGGGELLWRSGEVERRRRGAHSQRQSLRCRHHTRLRGLRLWRRERRGGAIGGLLCLPVPEARLVVTVWCSSPATSDGQLTSILLAAVRLTDVTTEVPGVVEFGVSAIFGAELAIFLALLDDKDASLGPGMLVALLALVVGGVGGSIYTGHVGIVSHVGGAVVQVDHVDSVVVKSGDVGSAIVQVVHLEHVDVQIGHVCHVGVQVGHFGHGVVEVDQALHVDGHVFGVVQVGHVDSHVVHAVHVDWFSGW